MNTDAEIVYRLSAADGLVYVKEAWASFDTADAAAGSRRTFADAAV